MSRPKRFRVPKNSNKKVLAQVAEAADFDMADEMAKRVADEKKSVKAAPPSRKPRGRKAKQSDSHTWQPTTTTTQSSTTFLPMDRRIDPMIGGRLPTAKRMSAKHRGRMIWAAYPRSAKNTRFTSVKFKSPALVGSGPIEDQFENARAEARVKASKLCKCKPEDIIVVQAGGFGEYYDESDKEMRLP